MKKTANQKKLIKSINANWTLIMKNKWLNVLNKKKLVFYLLCVFVTHGLAFLIIDILYFAPNLCSTNDGFKIFIAPSRIGSDVNKKEREKKRRKKFCVKKITNISGRINHAHESICEKIHTTPHSRPKMDSHMFSIYKQFYL